MKRKKVKKIVLIFLVIILLVLGYIIVNNSFTKKTKKEIKVLEEIKEYGYYLSDNDTSIYKKEFENLKTILDSDSINYEKYAKSISKLFIIDFYDLNSKSTNTDIGGTQFVYSKNKDNFILNAKNTMYKNVESNIYGDRKQELPKVTKVEISNIKEVSFKIDEKEYNGYETTMKTTYKKDLDYPESITIILIKTDKKLEIVKVETSK